MTRLRLLVPVVVLLLLAGCAGLDATQGYKPSNPHHLQGRVAIGVFTYKAFAEKDVRFPNMVRDRSAGNITLGMDVAELVRRNTSFELYHSGVRMDQSASYALAGEVLELRADDETTPVAWSYQVEYRFTDRVSGAVVYAVRTPVLRVDSPQYALSSNYVPYIEGLILAGYEVLVNDAEARKFLRAE